MVLTVYSLIKDMEFKLEKNITTLRHSKNIVR